MTQKEFLHNVMPLKNKLYSFAIGLLKNKEEAKDVVQDTFLKVWKSEKNIGDYTNLESWCMTLVRNRCLDIFKRKDRNNTGLDEYVYLKSEDNQPHENLEIKESLIQVKKIINSLPLLQQEIIFLRDFQEKSYKEIAEIVAIDINNVKANIHRARKTIKEKMNKISNYGMQSI